MRISSLPLTRPSTEPVFRQAEKEWKDFVEEFTSVIMEADPQIPYLPPKDVVHRIYRDVRVLFKPRESSEYVRLGPFQQRQDAV